MHYILGILSIASKMRRGAVVAFLSLKKHTAWKGKLESKKIIIIIKNVYL